MNDAPVANRLNASERELPLTELCDEYVSIAIAGRESEALALISAALDRGVTARNLYLHVLMPAQAQLGDLWHRGEVTIGEEHIATQITTTALGMLRQKLRPRPALGKRAVVTSLANDLHTIGGRVAADFLYMDGWDVDFLGANTPARALAEYVAGRQVDLVGISLTLEGTCLEAKEAIKLLRALPRAPKILLGGYLTRSNEKLVQSLGADSVAKNTDEALEQARSLVGLPPTSSYLQQYLTALGSRIQVRRKLQRLSQQQLAESSNLDRAYISAVEHGKHNLTLGAVMKLATALGISIEELLTG
jgi:methanogenic corrinoid protein MtbC1/DNA-binding XRE family transcriptional regulator